MLKLFSAAFALGLAVGGAAFAPAVFAQTACGPGSYSKCMGAAIARDRAESKPAALKLGKYSCYAGGRYTFSDLTLTGPHSYAVNGARGAYSYSNGALTFSSGPYAGAYSRMVDGHMIGVSSPGSTALGTQCGYEP